MPRAAKGARLHLRAERRDAAGNVTHHATWIIRDGRRDVFTGCAATEVAAAEQRLKDYIAAKYTPKRKVQDIETIAIADVLSIFIDDRRERQSNKHQFDKRMLRLNAWWGAKMLSEVTGETCREYQKHKGNRGGARRDLEDLRAAIRYHAKEGLHRGIVNVTLPGKGESRDRWLTRSEAARLLWACWRAREMQRRHRGAQRDQLLPTDKRPLRHLARFILIGLYTGTRAGAIASASPIPAIGQSFVDLDRGIFYRQAQGKQETNKRQPPVPIPRRLLAHMRRWKERKIIVRHFVEFNGEPVASVKTAFRRAVALAKLPGKVSPHTLRHTAATWLMQAGVDRWQAAGYLGMSVEMLENVYGHHHPDHLDEAVKAIGYGTRKLGRTEQKQDISGAVSGAVTKFRSLKDD
jgi:integrase